MSDLKRTSLHGLHSRCGARFVPFAGWEMPVQYDGIMEEHRNVRERAGLFDVSHMGEVRVRGAQAAAFLDYLVTNDVSRVRVGRGLYSPMCGEDGGVVDDLILYRVAAEEFLVVVNASNRVKDLSWMMERAQGFDCQVEDVSDSYALLALQGPEAEPILQGCIGSDLRKLKRFGIIREEVGGVGTTIARTGYTGEDGFELFCGWESGKALGEALLQAGEAKGLRMAGLGARDSLRLEAGFPLYGHEISEAIDPLRGGIGWTVKLGKEADFVGKAALQSLEASGLAERVEFFVGEDRRIGRPGMSLYLEDKVVGQVLSGTFSPILNRPIGSGLVDRSVWESSRLELDFRGKRAGVQIRKPPLHRQSAS